MQRIGDIYQSQPPSRYIQNTMKKHLDMTDIHGILSHDQANFHTF